MLDLSVRANNCLENAGIKFIGELVQRKERDLLNTRNFGRKSLREIQNKLSPMGLSLTIPDWPAHLERWRLRPPD